MKRISLPVGLSQWAARAALVAAALVTVGVAGATAASASVHPNANTFNCASTAGGEVCVGINYSGTFVYNVQIQVNIGYFSNDIEYTVAGPHIAASIGPYSGGPGWAQQGTVSVAEYFSHGDWFCGSAVVNGHDNIVATACAQLP